MVTRMPALKVRIADIMSGKWVRMEGMQASYIQTPSGLKISRARTLSTVVGKFTSEDGSFTSITLDDGTETIRGKVFQGSPLLARVEQGDIVDAIGKVKEYNGEIYLNMESASRISDPNMELLRRLELLSRPKIEAKEDKEAADKERLRKVILDLLKANPEGTTFEEIVKETKENEAALEPILDEMLNEGICYEPTPGKIRKI
ncbi:MAG: hypothetical protein HYX24_00435 [Candidatus Aenigmarchaeota archaeon]|nr:hypothetical protein [Candidatus Aenigmarchaeota archaeon]